MWQDAMADLNEQLHVEGIDQENEAPGQKSVSDYVLQTLSYMNFNMDRNNSNKPLC